MQGKLRAMLELQDSFNKKVHPEWINQGYAWEQAIFAELGELLEHVGYKWWKKQEPDVNQLTMEMVDIWHFGMSFDMVSYIDDMLSDADVVLPACIDELVDVYSNCVVEGPSPELNLSEFKMGIMALANGVTDLCFPYFDKQQFFIMWHSLGYTLDDLYKRYIGKNALNEFRQLNGYNTGTYVKVWNDREDNEHLTDVLDNVVLDENLYSTVLNQLAVEYSKL